MQHSCLRARGVRAEDESYDSPYVQAARKEGMDLPWWEKLASASMSDGGVQFGQLTGGKLDDITVLVARVSHAPPPQQERQEGGLGNGGASEGQGSGSDSDGSGRSAGSVYAEAGQER